MRKLRMLTLAGLLILSLVGCGGNPKEPVQESEPTISYGNWREKGFVVNDTSFIIDMNAAEPLYEIGSGEVVLPQNIKAEYSENVLTTWRKNEYYVLLEKKDTNKREYTLAKSVGDEAFEMTELPEISAMGSGRIVCMDVVTPEHISFLYVEEDEENQWVSCYVVAVGKQGEIISKENVLEGYEAHDIQMDDLVQGSWWCDEAGNHYLLQDDGKRTLIFDAEGKLLIKWEVNLHEESQILTAFHASDGELIFVENNMLERKTGLLWWDANKRQMKELASFPELYLRAFSMYEDGNIYFIYQSRLWKWNINTGDAMVLYNVLGSSIPTNSIDKYATHIAVLNQEEIKVIIQGEKEDRYCLLSGAEPEKEGIVLKDYLGETYIRECVVNYNKEHTEVPILYERESDNEENWTRTMAQLVAGKGPDMIYIHSNDERVQTLYDKGVLLELSDMLSEEIMSQIFPGIIEVGTIDGELVGICPKGMPIALWTSNRLWTKEGWSHTEVLTIIEENPHLQGLVVTGTEPNAMDNLYFLALEHEENSPYVDLENGISHFDTSDFIKALEMAKKYGELPKAAGGEKVKKIREGEYLTTFEYIFSPYAFVDMMKKYGEQCRMIGQPGQTEYVGYWTSTGVVLVNAKTVYKEEVAEFLEYLLCEQNQQKVIETSVREDIIRNSVYFDEYTGKWYIKAGIGSTLFTKTEDETYLEDYISFLKKLGPFGKESPIADIVEQEASEYFKGGRSAEEIAKIIDNRVQLYLDESK